MKKKMLTILTVGAVLAQSSGMYAMRRVQQAWESPRVQAVGRGMRGVGTALKPGARAQIVMKFLTQLASDIQTRGIRTAGQLRDLLMEYKKTTVSVVILGLITALFVAIGGPKRVKEIKEIMEIEREAQKKQQEQQQELFEGIEEKLQQRGPGG